MIKELLFNGADRSIETNLGETALDLLCMIKDKLDDTDFESLRFILRP